MGLLLDLAPDDGLDDSGGNEELEAELLALMGGGGGGGGGGGRGGAAGRKPGETGEDTRCYVEMTSANSYNHLNHGVSHHVSLCLHHVDVPIADIERMAALCMKDLDEDGDDDGDLENDADLLVRQKPSRLYIHCISRMKRF